MNNPFENEENTGVAVVNNLDIDFVGEIENKTPCFCTKHFAEETDRAKVFNIINNTSKSLKDYVNMEITLVDIFIENVTLKNEFGESITVPRQIYIDENGESYTTCSSGCFNSVKKLIQIVGSPSPDNPIKIIPKLVNKDKKNILKFDLA